MGIVYAPTLLEALRAGQPPSYLWSHGLAAAGIVALYWIAAYAMGRHRLIGAVTAIGVSALVAVLVMLPPDLGGMIVAAINLAIIALVLFNLRYFKRASDDVGA
jgi:cell division protein FtsW (lipid II flippase)